LADNNYVASIRGFRTKTCQAGKERPTIKQLLIDLSVAVTLFAASPVLAAL
jgi:hypothetical protein